MKPSAQRAHFLESVVLSVIALGVYNCAIQFLVYPMFERMLGADGFGDVLTLLSVQTVLALSAGAGINYARMANVPRFDAVNGDYDRLLAVCGGIVALAGAATLFFFDARGVSFVLYPLLGVFMLLRYYGSVAFRLEINYRKNFLFYILIAVGYVAGVGLFRLTGLWETAMLPGEILAVCYVVLTSTVLRPPLWKTSEYHRQAVRSCGALIPSQFLTNLTMHADRLLIGALRGGADVSVYYTASLLGKAMAMLTEPIAGVAIGFLARSKSFGRRQFLLCCAASLVCGGALFLVFIPMSPFLIGILYPDVVENASALFLIANGGQILYFIANLLLVIALRFMAEKYQLYINLAYGAAFFALGVPALQTGGLALFCRMALVLNVLRLAAVVLLGMVKSKNIPTDPNTFQRT